MDNRNSAVGGQESYRFIAKNCRDTYLIPTEVLPLPEVLLGKAKEQVQFQSTADYPKIPG